MKRTEALQAWGRVLIGRLPTLSIEITRECPLRCPGCYAYEDGHLGGEITLRQLVDHKGDDLVEGVLALVERYRPLHLFPKLNQRGVFVQVVTSAFRPIPASWAALSRFNLVVSIDGLQPEHDARRKPATYERILKNIAGHQVIIHCTITGQMMKRSGYLEEFLRFWVPRREIKKIWMSMFTPQRGDNSPECLSVRERDQAIEDLLRLREVYPKLDMGKGTIREFAHPPQSPEECFFARTTHVLSADLKTKITPCQFGGDPDCSRCGCMGSMALAAVEHHELVAGLTVGKIIRVSERIGKVVAKLRVADTA